MIGADIIRGNVASVKKLLESKADANTILGEKDENTWSPLQTAACYGHLPIMDLLLIHGADINSGNSGEGKSALTRAVLEGKYAAAVLLINHKADVNSKCLYGTSPMIAAIARGRVAIAHYLLTHHANSTITDLASYLKETWRTGNNYLLMGYFLSLIDEKQNPSASETNFVAQFYGNMQVDIRETYYGTPLSRQKHVRYEFGLARRYYKCYMAMIAFTLFWNKVYKCKDIAKFISFWIWVSRENLCWTCK